MDWEIKGKFGKSGKLVDIVSVLLANRGLVTKKEIEQFFKPDHPSKISLSEVGIDKSQVDKAIRRIKVAKEKNEKIIIYGDYDADGITATAILWECLYGLGLNVTPHIPNRFSEGYGINPQSINKLKEKYSDLSLIISVDNGIVANDAVGVASKSGIDVIITDHHQKAKKLPKAYSIIHTTKIGGAGVAWIFAREIVKKFSLKFDVTEQLSLVAIGTVSDQIPLLGVNRSLVKFGLEYLNTTTRPGLLAIYNEAGILPGNIDTYSLGFVISPRINAMGRLEDGIDSLRLLCTKNKSRAKELAQLLGKTNNKRQEVVEEVMIHAESVVDDGDWRGAIILAHSDYHEGVIGLAASKLVEKYYRPAVVFSVDKEIAKASARSVAGFNIIDAIRELDDMLLAGGGHPMAAGFSISTNRLEEFKERFGELSSKLLTQDILSPKIKIDLKLDFRHLSWDLIAEIFKFSPHGVGNPAPTFATENVIVLESKLIGKSENHLKMKLKKGEKIFDAIAFKMGDINSRLNPGTKIDIAYNFEENVWNGTRSMQLKVKDMKMVDTL